ncbi:uncharacterized protein EI90DRAFT_414488 [Cantharellus anzutake]|uniref:uncharacterized protein n=1 Tax=Cantharellus anzutake TaxID=1750568 RepID=UPI001904BC94|nr:uncharacterized protein EI90DRAFT_414488 [Cantharellus anzutake]KAF8314831.1 hypothetical protein EI90DRAFT_414488 [Cantharellus anzutake]
MTSLQHHPVQLLSRVTCDTSGCLPFRRPFPIPSFECELVYSDCLLPCALFGILQENGYGFPVNEPFLGPFSEVVTWFKALRDVVEVETEREFLLPTGPVELDAPLCLDALSRLCIPARSRPIPMPPEPIPAVRVQARAPTSALSSLRAPCSLPHLPLGSPTLGRLPHSHTDLPAPSPPLAPT